MKRILASKPGLFDQRDAAGGGFRVVETSWTPKGFIG